MPSSGLYRIDQEKSQLEELLEAKKLAFEAISDILGEGSIYHNLTWVVLVNLFEEISPNAREYAVFHEFVGSTPEPTSKKGDLPRAEKLLEVLWDLQEKIRSSQLNVRGIIPFLEERFQTTSLENDGDSAAVRVQKGTRRYLKEALSEKDLEKP